MATTTTPDLLDPNAPKKTPGPAKLPAAQPDMGGGAPSAIASPSTVDTGVPPPSTAPSVAPPPMAIETQAQPGPPQQAPALFQSNPNQAEALRTASSAAAGLSPQQAMQQAAAAWQAKHGRAPTPAEQNELTRQAQAMGWTGGPIPQSIVDAVIQGIGTPTPAAPLPPGAITAESGVAQANAAAEARLGRPLTPQEIGVLGSRVGPPQGPGGTYTQAQLDQALDYIARYSGRPEQPFGPLAEEAPGSTTSLANTRLAELLNLEYGEVDPESQAIQQPLGAFRSAQSRATDRARIAMALRNQSQGIDPSSGAAEAGLLGLLEEQGQNEAGFEANLITQELATQRQQLTQAIELATQAGLQNKARELQAELGKLDIKLREMIGKGQLALGAQQLSQQDQQFLESLGFNYANLQANMNNSAINALLG